MRETLTTLFVGAMLGLLVMSYVIDHSARSPQNIISSALNECEKDLPRSQHCKIIAIPVDKD